MVNGSMAGGSLLCQAAHSRNTGTLMRIKPGDVSAADRQTSAFGVAAHYARTKMLGGTPGFGQLGGTLY